MKNKEIFNLFCIAFPFGNIFDAMIPAKTPEAIICEIPKASTAVPPRLAVRQLPVQPAQKDPMHRRV